MSVKPRVLVSILSLGRPENVLRQLENLPQWLSQLVIPTHIVVRNNDPATSFASVAARIAEIRADYPEVGCTLLTDVPNNGFGGGHNSNMALVDSDFVLILNDDIGFPHMAWLSEALAMLGRDPDLGAVAAEENPRFINPLFGNGLLPGAFHLQGLTYGEASILLCRRAALEASGRFHDDYAWAMCEDADLSLRLQQLGYTIAYMSMPHQHWRSTSFNSLPGQVKSSILEHNRAALFANWRESLASGFVGRFEVFDLWSDGIGDVFCALPHVAARLQGMTTEQRANVIVNTNHKEIFGWLGFSDIRVESERDIMKLRHALAPEGLATLRSSRDTNFSLPFNIHVLLSGALGIPLAGQEARAAFASNLHALRPPSRLPTFEGKTAVIHMEFSRDHDGRSLSPGWMAKIVSLCGEIFETVVLIGQEKRLSETMCASPRAKIIDLQGRLSLTQLAAVLGRAAFFVGIDSFPAHLAQAMGINAAIFFGSVHPLTRAWDARRVWPLMAALDCIGCYHTHLEPSVPFCMRRDQACTQMLEETALKAVLQSMADGIPYDWSAVEQTLQAFQARLIKLTKFHPAPPQRVFRAQGMPNESVSNMIYRMTDQLGDLLRGQYQTSTVNALSAQVQTLQAQVFTGRVQLDDTRRQLRAAQIVQTGTAQPEANRPSLLQLAELNLEAVRCQLTVKEHWIEIEATDDDPQLLLPPIYGRDGKVQLRLSCAAEPNEALQIYWAMDDEPYSPENVRTVPADSGVASANLVMDVAEGQVLRLRIDPITGIGAARLQGSLGGTFARTEEEGLENGIVPLPAGSLENGMQRRGKEKRAGARASRRSAVH